MGELKLIASKKQLDELFDLWDVDKSGKLKIAEFEKLLARRTEITYGAPTKGQSAAAAVQKDAPTKGASRRDLGQRRCSSSTARSGTRTSGIRRAEWRSATRT